ncbi:hypothetical protein SLS55_010225 [Diplodia seriata]|uniref:BTB domain-containing protein n=1 Tax=Diplodia seriata TaxID=420778 RepID=A0ABR3BXX7_9PEZI
MAGEKRNADASADSTAPKKKSQPIDNFPKFHDGDVTIIIGDLELKLHSKLLIAKCKFFAGHAGCKQFAIRPYNPDEPLEQDMDCPPLTVAPYETTTQKSNNEGNPTTTSTIEIDDYIKRSRAANEAFFRLLYKGPLSSLTPAEFRDVAILTSDYGCVQRIKDALIIAFFKANLGNTPFRDNPWAILYAADQLKDEALYHEAMVHITGRGGLRSNDKKFVHPWSVVEITKQTNELEDKVRECWTAAMGCCKHHDVSTAVAAGAMRLYIDNNVPCPMRDLLRPEIYHALLSLHNKKDVEGLLDSNVDDELNDLDNGLCAGMHALEFLQDSSVIDENTYNSLAASIKEGYRRAVSGRSAEVELEALLRNIQAAIKPLFVGDRNVGYFTCAQIKVPNSWKNPPSADSENGS